MHTVHRDVTKRFEGYTPLDAFLEREKKTFASNIHAPVFFFTKIIHFAHTKHQKDGARTEEDDAQNSPKRRGGCDPSGAGFVHWMECVRNQLKLIYKTNCEHDCLC